MHVRQLQHLRVVAALALLLISLPALHLRPLESCTVGADSYNSGMYAGALAHLHLVTGNLSFLASAKQVAMAAMESGAFTDSRGIVRENFCEGRPASCGDGIEFRGPFVRGLSMLYQVQPEPRLRDFIQRSMLSALRNDCNEKWRFEIHWAGPYDQEATAQSQIPVLDLFAASYAVL
mmetsp:Transcript_39971/g.80077  ORF Transcript_39971/g.80077 Transcript_39971/m.80077 type:complete len:177 (-) Transcript_39971:93-623(-)